MKKLISILLALLICSNAFASAQQKSMPQALSQTERQAPPELPEGEMPRMGTGEKIDGAPPELPEGEMPRMSVGEEPDGAPPERPDGEMPGGMQGAPESYQAVYASAEDAQLDGKLLSEGKDENAVLVTGGKLSLSDAQITRISSDSTGGDASSFYGVGAAVLTTGGQLEITNSAIETDAAGGAGVFAYGEGVVRISDSAISTVQNASGGIHVAGGGTLYARNLTVTTQGESSAAIRSDRGSGVMVVDGGSYASSGVGSPAVYVTADVTIHNADLKATGSEALCLEGLNAVRLYDCDLSGAMQDLRQNDHTWTVIVYQSMSGDSQLGEGRFEMVGGALKSENGGIFYTTNTESEFILENVDITAAQDCEYFLRVSGNANERGWGESGKNGADCTFTARKQQMQGNVIWDSISNLNMYALDGSCLEGAVVQDESYALCGGDGGCRLNIDEGSTWVVSGDSRLSELYCAGTIVDVYGNRVPVVSASGELLVEGDSGYCITVDRYENSCDASGAGEASSWKDHAVEF